MPDTTSVNRDGGASKDAPRVFTERFKARNRILGSAAIVLGSVAPFALGLIAITFIVPDPTSWVAGIVTVAAFLTSGACTWLIQNRLALMGNGALRHRLVEVLGDCELLTECKAQPSFIGFAPGDSVLTWDGETDLDVGFLCLMDGALVFVGDRFTWSLSRGRVDRVDLMAAPMGPRRIVVHWHAPREPKRSFSLESREASSLRAIDEATVRLFKGLRQWTLGQEDARQDAEPLGYPPTNSYGGRPLDVAPSGACLTVFSMMVIIVLTTWYLVNEMMADNFRYHAVLWAGFVFVGGTVFTRFVLHYLQSTGPLMQARESSNHRDGL